MRFQSRRSTASATVARATGQLRCLLQAPPILPLVCAALCLGGNPSSGLGRDPLAEDPFEAEREPNAEGKLLVVSIRGEITPSLVSSTRTEVEASLANHEDIRFVVFELDTPGGAIDASRELANFIFRLKRVRTIAWVPPDRNAYSGGTMIALAAQDIVMGTNSHIGDVIPVAQESRNRIVELPEKVQSPIRSLLRSYASARDYPTILIDAMVSKDHPDILAADFADSEIGTANEVIKTRYLTRSDYDNLTREKKTTLQRGELRTVLENGKVLTVDAKLAKEYGFARAIADDIHELQVELRIEVAEVIDASSSPLKANSPTAQSFVNFCNRPFVRFLLIAGGLLGVFLEFQIFGAALPGIFGLLCFVVFFGTSLFPVSGTLVASATVWEVLVFPLGLALVAVEFFLPGVAIFALSGGALCLTSLILAMVPPDGGVAGETTVRQAITVLIFGFGAGAIGFAVLLRSLPRSRLLARRGLVSRASIDGVSTANSALEAQARDSQFVGQEGVAVTPLHPAGKVELDTGPLVDVVTSGDYVARGNRVRIVEVRGGRTVVTPTIAPAGGEANSDVQAS